MPPPAVDTLAERSPRLGGAAQRAFIGSLEDLGHRWAVVRSIDDARVEIERLGVVTREAVSA